MKSLSIADYLALATIFLFVAPFTLWTVVHAIWVYGMVISPAVA